MLSGLPLDVRCARRTGGVRRIVPQLELLEARDCPAAPIITSFTATQLGTVVELSGTVTDENPATAWVDFTGAALGSASLDSLGRFSVTLSLGALEAIHAEAFDEEALDSETVSRTPTNVAPTIVDFQAIAEEAPSNVWTFRGRVVDEWAPGLTIYLSGLPSLGNQPVQVDENGYFSFTTVLPEGEEGVVTANVTDWWGVAAATAYAMVRS